MTLAEMCATPVTLNGLPARVTRTGDGFAMITQVQSGLGAEWSWGTVRHVIQFKNGEFKS